MLPLRKPVDPALTARPADAVPVEPDTPVHSDATHRAAGGDLPVSPALLLREQLAARLAAADAGPIGTPAAIDVPETKLPMAMRVATIVTLSVGLWGAIFLSAMRIVTG